MITINKIDILSQANLGMMEYIYIPQVCVCVCAKEMNNIQVTVYMCVYVPGNNTKASLKNVIASIHWNKKQEQKTLNEENTQIKMDKSNYFAKWITQNRRHLFPQPYIK